MDIKQINKKLLEIVNIFSDKKHTIKSIRKEFQKLDLSKDIGFRVNHRYKRSIFDKKK